MVTERETIKLVTNEVGEVLIHLPERDWVSMMDCRRSAQFYATTGWRVSGHRFDEWTWDPTITPHIEQWNTLAHQYGGTERWSHEVKTMDKIVHNKADLLDYARRNSIITS